MFEVFAKETPLVKIVSSRRRFGWRRIGSSSGGGSGPGTATTAAAHSSEETSEPAHHPAETCTLPLNK